MNPTRQNFIDALPRMGNEFTSYEFCDMVRKVSGKDFGRIINAAHFLKKNTIQLTSKTWKKKEHVYLENKQEQKSVVDEMKGRLDLLPSLRNEKTAIKFLKSLGYKILKPKSEWVEV